MEIQCPSCKVNLEAQDGLTDLACPSCGSTLEVLKNENGLTIVSIRKQIPEKPKAEAGGNLLVEEYQAWQMRAAFIAVCGIAFGIILFMDIKDAYVHYGPHFWKIPGTMTAVPILLVLTLLPLLAGGWLYWFCGKKADEARHINK